LQSKLYKIVIVVSFGGYKVPINQLEANLEAINITIAYMEKKGNCDKEILKKLKEERMRLLKELNVIE
jgi:hypothetical protein